MSDKLPGEPEEPILVRCLRAPTKAVVYNRFSRRDAEEILAYIDALRAFYRERCAGLVQDKAHTTAFTGDTLHETGHR